MVFNIPAGSQPVLTPTGYRIQRSLRFNPADSTYLYRLFGTPTNQNAWTLSLWVKRVSISVPHDLFGYDINHRLHFTANDSLAMTLNGVVHANSDGYARYRDTSAWMHVVCRFGGTANGSWVLVNNALVASSVETDNNNWINTAAVHHLGVVSSGSFLHGYLADVIFVDGQVLLPTDFAETDSATGVWVPKKYTGSYGNNGFWLPLSNNSSAAALGTDMSGRGNNFSPSGISATTDSDSMVDSPTNYGTDNGNGGEVRGNYATMTRTDVSTFMLTGANGRLDLSLPVGTSVPFGNHATFTIPAGVGKWYWEYRCGAIPPEAGNWQGLGVINAENYVYPEGTMQIGKHGAGFAYYNSGAKMSNGTDVGYGAAWTTNDVIGVALDATAPSITFYKNNVSQGVAYAFPGWFNFTPVVDIWRHASIAQTGFVNFGQRPFTYPAPAGHKCLCTQNLPDPAVKRGDDAFVTHLRSGTGAPYSVTGKRFKPDLVFLKLRNGVSDFFWYDSVRGPTKEISHPALAHEIAPADGITSFNADGYTSGVRFSTAGQDWVDWMFKKGAVPGLDIVTYTGNNVARNIPHSLGATPVMMIVKERAAAGLYGWYVYHANFGPQYFFSFNSPASYTAEPTCWHNTNPTSTNFTVGAYIGTNENGAQYVAYLFADVPGFSKFGYYGGNNSLDGPFIWTGFKPAFVMVKATHTGMHWSITDKERNVAASRIGNPAIMYQFPSLTVADSNQSGHGDIDMLANGFKIREDGVGYNDPATGYIYAAFAEHPFKYARVR